MNKLVEIYEQTHSFSEVMHHTAMPAYKVHIILAKAGVLRIQDKIKYGTKAQRLGGQAEKLFAQLVPGAVDVNEYYRRNNPVYDFMYGKMTIDVKYSSILNSKKADTWCISLKGGQDITVAFLESQRKRGLENPYVLIVPACFATVKKTTSICRNSPLFKDFTVTPEQLKDAIYDYSQLYQ